MGKVNKIVQGSRLADTLKNVGPKPYPHLRKSSNCIFAFFL